MSVDEDFGSRLALLERHAQSTEKRLDNVDSALGRIEAALTKAEAKPAFDPARILAFVKDAGILVGMGAAAIIYIAANISSTPLAVMASDVAALSKRVETMEFANRWKAEIRNQ
jgi:hypothetical protein